MLTLINKIKKLLPPLASPLNPVDMTGIADYDIYRSVLSTIMEIENVHLVIVIFVSQGLITSDGPAKAVVKLSPLYDKPLLAYWMGGGSVREGIATLKEGNIPIFNSPAKVARAAFSLFYYSDFRKKLVQEKYNKVS